MHDGCLAPTTPESHLSQRGPRVEPVAHLDTVSTDVRDSRGCQLMRDGWQLRCPRPASDVSELGIVPRTVRLVHVRCVRETTTLYCTIRHLASTHLNLNLVHQCPSCRQGQHHSLPLQVLLKHLALDPDPAILHSLPLQVLLKHLVLDHEPATLPMWVAATMSAKSVEQVVSSRQPS